MSGRGPRISKEQREKNKALIREIEANENQVNGEPAAVHHGHTGRPDRIDAYYGSPYGHLVSNDGMNAEYLREPGASKDEYTVDSRQDKPYND